MEENKIFLNELPKRSGITNQINWKECKNHKVKGIYYNFEFEFEIIDYERNRKSHLTILYNNKEFEIKIDYFKNCQVGRILGKHTNTHINNRTNKFKSKVGQNFKDSKRDITIIDIETRPSYNKDGSFKQNLKYYKYHCNKDDYEGWITENNLFSKRIIGCPSCAGRTVIQGINDIPTTNPEMVKFFQGGIEEALLYTKTGSGNPNNPNGMIYPLCPECGRVKTKKVSINTIYKSHSIGCSCGDGISYPSKIMFNILEQLNINFETEYSPDWIKPKRYDFYIPLINKIIETDGGFHTRDNSMSGQTKEDSKEIDDYKDRLALEHGIEVIRVDCFYIYNNRFECIKNNTLNNNRLNELLDLNNINWLKCGEFALSNLIKIACEYKKENPELTTGDIGKLMKLSTQSIKNYLRQGSKYGWCKYDGEMENFKVVSAKRKMIAIFKDKNILSIFESASKLSRQSEKLFGVKLTISSISNACLGKIEQYNGYTFKYTEDFTPQEYLKYDIENKLKELKLLSA